MPNGNTSSRKRKVTPTTAVSASAKTAKPSAGTAVDALSLLVQDHRDIDRLFNEFEEAQSDAERNRIANAICSGLKVHARLEEDLFYPAVYSRGTAGLLAEAKVEHASAKDLVAQIEASAPGDPLYGAKVKVLGEYVRHHVAEEEEQIFPLCQRSNLDLKDLGQALATRKQQLMRGIIVSNPIFAVPA